MKKRIHFLLAAAVIAATTLSGCKERDLDLTNISTNGATVHAALTMPIGQVSTTFADMVGLLKTDSVNGVQFYIDADSIIHVRYAEHFDRSFHDIDMSAYAQSVNKTFLVQDAAPGLPLIPAATEYPLTFSFDMAFDSINCDKADERIDSMQVSRARFTSRVNAVGLNITDEDIQSVTIVLGDEFHRAAGKRIELTDFHLGQNVPIEVDNFTLVFMIDPNGTPSNTNVKNTANISFEIKLKPQSDVPVTAASAFQYNFGINFISYQALYGYFQPGVEMRNNHADFPFDFGLTNQVGELLLPATDPKITLKVGYGIAAPINIFLRHLYTVGPDGQRKHATWSGQTYKELEVATVIPINAPLDTYVVDSSIVINKEDNSGNLDNCFTHQIDSVCISYDVQLDQSRADANNQIIRQFRISGDQEIHLDIELDAPLNFDKGLHVESYDTIHDVNLSVASLDSLTARTNGVVTQIDSADAVLYLTFVNEIPVKILLDAQLLDENGNDIGYTDLNGIVLPSNSEDYKTIAIHREDFDKIATTRAIRFHYTVGDAATQSSIPANKRLTVKAGIAANVQAVVDLTKLTNGNQNNQ